MNSQQIKPGLAVVYWPVRKPDGSFEGEPLETTVASHPWNNHGIDVCMIAGKSGFVAISHLELKEFGPWQIVQLKRDPSGHWMEHGKRDGFTSRIAALDKFSELTAGGFEQPNHNTIYRWEFREPHVTEIVFTVD